MICHSSRGRNNSSQCCLASFPFPWLSSNSTMTTSLGTTKRTTRVCVCVCVCLRNAQRKGPQFQSNALVQFERSEKEKEKVNDDETQSGANRSGARGRPRSSNWLADFGAANGNHRPTDLHLHVLCRACLSLWSPISDSSSMFRAADAATTLARTFATNKQTNEQTTTLKHWRKFAQKAHHFRLSFLCSRPKVY